MNVRLKIESMGWQMLLERNTISLYECAAAPGVCSIVFTEIERVLTVSIYS